MDFGLGLRTPHYEAALEGSGGVDFFEIISENFMVAGGKPLHYLDAIAERYPVVLHGVSMSVGGADEPRPGYLRDLRRLADRVGARWVSDHLCWVGASGVSSYDLLPLPHCEEAIERVVARITRIQDALERPLVLENISRYVTLEPDQMEEARFINEITRASGAKLLLDINNVYVNARNHGVDAYEFLERIDVGSVVQFHLAGHTDNGDHVIDTHDAPISAPVFALFEAAVSRFGAVATSIERDDAIPAYEELVAELDDARAAARRSHVSALAS